MPLLVYAAGASDLLLHQSTPEGQGPSHLRTRLDELTAAFDATPDAVARELAGDTHTRPTPANGADGQDGAAGAAGADGSDRGWACIPLVAALRAVAAARADGPDQGLDLLLLGTRQQPSNPGDTLPIAELLARAVPLLADRVGCVVRSTRVVQVDGLTEDLVISALAGHLPSITGTSQAASALVAWGSGAIALTMGTLTALAKAGVPWRLVTTFAPASAIVDPLDHLEPDPVVGVLIRWRLFGQLAELVGPAGGAQQLAGDAGVPAAAADQDGDVGVAAAAVHQGGAAGTGSELRLTSGQLALVRAAVERRDHGLRYCDSPSMRAVVADAVVRRDGTAGLAVRRYIVSRYDALLTVDRRHQPAAADLLKELEEPRGGPPLGVKIAKLRRVERDDQAGKVAAKQRDLADTIRPLTGLPSYRWLHSPETNDLQEVGRGSHRLEQPDDAVARRIGDHLARWDVDGTGWAQHGLPVPPLVPADTALAVWVAGNQPADGRRSIGEQLVAGGPPAAVRHHLGVERCAIAALVCATGDEVSQRRACADVDMLTADEQVARTLDIGQPVSGAAVEQAVAAMLSPRVGALLLVPTGPREALLTLVRVLRRIGARHGLPLFVRECADPPSAAPAGATTYLWPALTGGDLPLLRAARATLRSLELDVAWRLLAASAAEPADVDAARRLATAFACRNPGDHDAWPACTDPQTRTLGMAHQRIALVRAAMRQATAVGDRIRLLVLAAGALESSLAVDDLPSQRKGAHYGAFRDDCERALRSGTGNAGPAAVLWLLNAVRDKVSITHGDDHDPERVVACQRARLIDELAPSPAVAQQLPGDATTLVDRAVDAAEHLAAERLGRTAPGPDDLVREQQRLLARLDQEICRRPAGGGVSR